MQIELEAHETLEDLRKFVTGNGQVSVRVPGRKAAYEHIGKVLRRHGYWKLGKADKGVVRQYLQPVAST